ncbi:MAG: hypothetical protein ABSG97_03330 [Sedimentisphaerales bacterium]|jgi:hypothetical protein
MFTQTIDNEQNLARQVPKEELYGLAVDTTVLFSDHKGNYKRRIESHQRNLLAKLRFLAPFLEPGERILHVISGCSPATFVEQLLTGILLQPLKQSLFAVTNRRILHVPTTRCLRHRWSVAQIVYADCRYIHIRWATLVVKYKSGRTEKFRCIGWGGRKETRAVLKDVSLDGRSSPSMERTHLCPRCTKPLIRGYYACPSCSLEFKNKSWATTLSIIFPGGGYFYTRHPIIGIIEAVMETIVFLLLVTAATAFSLSPHSAPRSIIQAIMLCAIVLGFEKMATAMFSSKCVEEFIPKQRRVKVLIDQSPAQRSSDKPGEMFAVDWRSR